MGVFVCAGPADTRTRCGADAPGVGETLAARAFAGRFGSAVSVGGGMNSGSAGGGVNSVFSVDGGVVGRSCGCFDDSLGSDVGLLAPLLLLAAALPSWSAGGGSESDDSCAFGVALSS